MKKNFLYVAVAYALIMVSQAIVQEKISDVFADPTLDIKMPDDRAKARGKGITVRQELPNRSVAEIVGLHACEDQFKDNELKHVPNKLATSCLNNLLDSSLPLLLEVGEN